MWSLPKMVCVVFFFATLAVATQICSTFSLPSPIYCAWQASSSFSPQVSEKEWHAGGAQYWNQIKSIVPRNYNVFRVKPDKPILFEGGDVFSDCWEHAPWTEPFVDIEGPEHKPNPPDSMETRMKMLWDDEALYVAAWLVEPQVVATLTEKNSVIFHDNDFEVFLNPDGSHHEYYEFEVNAFNTVWELRLNKPYKCGGGEHSARVGMPGQGNLANLRSAVRVRGAINDAGVRDEGWSVVCRFPFADLAAQGHCRGAPLEGDVWRMTSSRVQWRWAWVPAPPAEAAAGGAGSAAAGGHWEKQPQPGHGLGGEDNWAWTPQGVVSMHAPERWGFLRFRAAAGGDGGDAEAGWVPGDWAARELLVAAHSLMADHTERLGRPAASLAELGLSPPAPAAASEARRGGGVAAAGVELRPDLPGGWAVWARPDGAAAAAALKIRSDMLVWAEEPLPQAAAAGDAAA